MASLAGLLNTTTLPAPTAGHGRPQYFRTHFNLASLPLQSIILSNRIDDQVVFYLNGTRIADIRHPENPEICSTNASGGGTGETTAWENITIPIASLAGIIHTDDNVLAASVHQEAPGSSDMVFVCALWGRDSTPIPTPPISFTNMAGPITFDTAPPAEQWSTRTWPGTANGTADEPSIVDDAVQLLAASTINVPLPGVVGNPPDSGGSAQYAMDAGAHYVVTRPANTLGDLLMATVRNDSGTTLNTVILSYALTVSAPLVEQINGHLVYYSRSGAPNSWVQLPVSNEQFDNTAGSYSKNASLDLSANPWTPGSLLYVLWVDDNGSGSPDGALQIDDVTWTLPGPPRITSCTSVTNQTVLQCRNSAMMSVAGTGSFQWTKDGVDIPGANSSSYAIVNMDASKAGRYSVRVFNGMGSTSCPPTTITYQADFLPPAPIAAIASNNLIGITVTFNEPIDTNVIFLADIPFDWKLVDMNTSSQVFITNAVAPNDITISVQTEGINPAHGHSLRLVGVQDKCTGNVLPDTTVAVQSIRTQVLPLNAIWRYDDTTDTNAIAANWTQQGYNDRGAPWQSGTGPFDAKRNAAGAAGSNCRDIITNYFSAPDIGNQPVGTCIRLTSPVTGTNLITANFRTHFTYTGNPSNAVLELIGKFDDAGLVYLNGSEVARLRLAAGPVSRTQQANTVVNDQDPQDFIQLIRPASLQYGDNVLAVELHQQVPTSSDLTMGVRLVAVTTAPLPLRPQAMIVHKPNGDVEVSWTGGSGTLVSSSDPTAALSSWTPVAGTTNPRIIPAGTLVARRFYAVRVP